MRKAKAKQAEEFRDRYLNDEEQRILMVLDCYGNALARHVDKNECNNC